MSFRHSNQPTLSVVMLWLLGLYAALSLYSGYGAAAAQQWILAGSHAFRVLLIAVVFWEFRSGAVPLPMAWRAATVRTRLKVQRELSAPGALQKWGIGAVIAFIVLAVGLPAALANIVVSALAFVLLFGAVARPPGPRLSSKRSRSRRGPLN